jgi:hypothetical protein
MSELQRAIKERDEALKAAKTGGLKEAVRLRVASSKLFHMRVKI